MRRSVLSLIGGIVCLASHRGLAATEILQAPGPKGPLVGTLERADNPHAPVVLIIPGSGPTDRDGDNAIAGKSATYRLLANGLASHGITTLRVDKRGLFGSAAAIANPNDVTIEDYAADVGTWVEILRDRTGASCAWVLGHSEGGLVALAAARHEPPHGPGICGLVLVAAPGRPLGEVIESQLRANPANAPILPDAMATLKTLEAGHRVDATHLNPALAGLFRPAVQGLLISEMALDPAHLIAAVTRPVLIVQGERDLQVAPTDAQRLADANRHATLALLPDVNHVLKTVTSGSRAANFATYGDPTLPLAPGISDRIAAFVLGNGQEHH